MASLTNPPIHVSLKDVAFVLNGANLSKVLRPSASFTGLDPRINMLRELMTGHYKAWERLYLEDPNEFAMCRYILEDYTHNESIKKAATQALSDLTAIAQKIKGKGRLTGGSAESTALAPLPSSGRGLPNLRNTCYVNAVLQGAFISPEMLAALNESFAFVEEPYLAIHQSLSCIVQMSLDPRLEAAVRHPKEPIPLQVRDLQEKLVQMQEIFTRRIALETQGLGELRDCLPFAKIRAEARLKELNDLVKAIGGATPEITAEKRKANDEYYDQVTNINTIKRKIENYKTIIRMLKEKKDFKANLLRIFLFECDANFPGINWGPQGDSEEILVRLLNNLKLENFRTIFQYKGYTREKIAQDSNTRFTFLLPHTTQHLFRSTRPFEHLQVDYNSTLIEAQVQERVTTINREKIERKEAELTPIEIQEIRAQVREEFVARPLDLQNLLIETFTRAERVDREIPNEVIHPVTLEKMVLHANELGGQEFYHEEWRRLMISAERLPRNFMFHLPRLKRNLIEQFEKNNFALTGLIDIHPGTHLLQAPRVLTLNVFAPMKRVQDVTHPNDLRPREVAPIAITPISFICHSGSARGGHYYAIVYNKHLRKWEYISDSIVRDATEADIIGVRGKDGIYTGGLHRNVVMVNLENTTLRRLEEADNDHHLSDGEQQVLARQRSKEQDADSGEHKEKV